MNLLRLIVVVCIICLAGTNSALADVYYVNAKSGLDSNEGTSPEKAWASLKKINKQVFNPGDKILLAAGSRFTGQLEPKGSGTASAPILLDRYGQGPNPAIDGLLTRHFIFPSAKSIIDFSL